MALQPPPPPTPLSSSEFGHRRLQDGGRTLTPCWAFKGTIVPSVSCGAEIPRCVPHDCC